MSSDHVVIVARNTESGEVRLPLGNVTLYSTERIDDFVRRVCADYGDEWVVAAYLPTTGFFIGTKPTENN